MQYNIIYVACVNFMKKVAIVGGGVLGLSLAYFLSNKQIQVDIIEKNVDVGGLASGFRVEGSYLERYYHHIFKSDTEIQKLFNDLVIGKSLHWIKSNAGMFYNNNSYDFSTSLDLLKFSPVSFFGRIRAGLVSMFLLRAKDYKKFENISAIDWCNKYYGKEFTNIIWKQLLLAKFGNEYYDKISMAWLWTRVHDRSSSRKGIMHEYLGYPDGSFKIFIDALKQSVKSKGCNIYLGSEVIKHNIYNEKHQILIRTPNGELKNKYDSVIVTGTPISFLNTFSIGKKYKEKLLGVKYLGALCCVLELNQPFTKYYWLNIADPKAPFTAVVEHTNFVDKSLFANKSILYIGKYLKSSDRLFNLSKSELLDLNIEYLKKINKNFDKSWIINEYYFKSEYAQHIVPVGYKPFDYATGVKGLYYANFSQVYPHDRGMNYAIEQAKYLSELLF